MQRLRSIESRAGKSAERRYKYLARAWRKRVLKWYVIGPWVVIVAGLGIAARFVEGDWKFTLGVLAGGFVGMLVALLESPPGHIENWQRGSWGERWTARALRPLRKAGWVVRHDLEFGERWNVDHVVAGPPGLFLLDTKNHWGEARVEDGKLRIHMLEDLDVSYACEGIIQRMKGQAADLKERIEAAMERRIWVQPVVVLWSRFPQKVVESDGVFFVHGDELERWLRERPPATRAVDIITLGQCLDRLNAS